MKITGTCLSSFLNEKKNFSREIFHLILQIFIFMKKIFLSTHAKITRDLIFLSFMLIVRSTDHRPRIYFFSWKYIFSSPRWSHWGVSHFSHFPIVGGKLRSIFIFADKTNWMSINFVTVEIECNLCDRREQLSPIFFMKICLNKKKPTHCEKNDWKFSCYVCVGKENLKEQQKLVCVETSNCFSFIFHGKICLHSH